MIIKNIALAGHAGTGKTTLLEALLYQGGCVERMGSVAAGTTVSDAAPEEIKRHSSWQCVSAPFRQRQWKNRR